MGCEAAMGRGKSLFMYKFAGVIIGGSDGCGGGGGGGGGF